MEDMGVDPNTQKARPGLKSLQKELGGPANCYIATVDVSNREQFNATCDDLETKLPALTGAAILDVAFANAGIGEVFESLVRETLKNPSHTFGAGRGGLFALQPFQDHLDVMNVNFLGVLITIYGSLKLMKDNPGALVFSTSSSSAMVCFRRRRLCFRTRFISTVVLFDSTAAPEQQLIQPQSMLSKD